MQWQMAFRVSETQDRDTRYAEVRNIPNINATIEAAGAVDDCEAAKTAAFAHIDSMGILQPYQIYLQGNRDEQLFILNITVEPSH